MHTAIRSMHPCSMFATLAGALVLAAVTGLSLDAVPALPAKIILGVSFPVFYGTALAAIRPPSRPGPGTRSLGPRPDGATPVDGTPAADDDLRQRSEAERLRAWRRAHLAALGVPEDVAVFLAQDRSFSPHELKRLLAQGCPLGTALRILWPT